MKILPHPPFLADLSICDFGLFRAIKQAFTGNDFDDAGDLKNEIERFFSQKKGDFFFPEKEPVSRVLCLHLPQASMTWAYNFH